MRIDSSIVGMDSARSYRASGASVRHFVIRDYQRGQEENTSFGNALSGSMPDSGEKKWSEEEKKSGETEKENARQRILQPEEWQNRYGIRTGRLGLQRENRGVSDSIRQITLRYIFDMLFAARRGRLNRWLEENGYGAQKEAGQSESAQNGDEPTEQVQSSQGQLNFQRLDLPLSRMRTLSMRQEGWYQEEEHTSFSSTGTVKTSDGREIQFQVDVAMSRSFEEYFSQEVEQMNFALCDPLVINMDVGTAQLQDQKFYFDLDADGQEDEISMLGSGSGYLALDKNGDGRINDGSELFGTSSGDGFRDLAQYDQDHNGWIDENDEIWSKLKIWTKNEQGEDELYTLSDKGVGAIYLGSADTDFTLTAEKGATNGMIRKTGIFLYENGAAGTMQHVDVAKYRKEA